MPDDLTMRERWESVRELSARFQPQALQKVHIHAVAALAALDQAPSVLSGTDEQMRVINDPVLVPATRNEGQGIWRGVKWEDNEASDAFTDDDIEEGLAHGGPH